MRSRYLGVGLVFLIGCEAGAEGGGETDTDAASDTDTAAGTDASESQPGTTTDQSGSGSAQTTGGDEDDASETTPGTTTSQSTDTSTGSDTSGGEDSDTDPDACVIGSTLPSEVVMIGDSYFAITSLPTALWVNARLDGSLGAQETWRPYYISGTQMSNGEIPGEFATALADDPNITTVVMNGGGNDVLSGSASVCLNQPPPSQVCGDAIDVVISVASDLLDDMAAAGVENVVYFFYPHLPPGFPPGAKNETLDYAAPLIQGLCEGHTGLACHFVDIRDAFEGHPEYISADAIHPTNAGSQAIADLVWERMVENCIAR